LSVLQPGDLVFKGPGGSVHVAIYVGHGMQIAATHTGSFVLLQPVDYAHLSGAVRPG
jgi:cell wall-associated NlpC family hydrolase